MNRNDLRRVDMNLLVIFEALMFEKNLTRVAEKLFMGQPAVSAALGRLRDLFDDPLLLRNGRGMEPTPRAVAILKELQPAMDTISGAVSRAKDFDPSTSCAVFRIGLSDDAEFGLFPPLLSQLREEAPGIIVVVRRANYLLMSSLLASGEITVGVSYTTELPANAKRKKLRDIPCKVLRGDDGAAPLTLDDYCERPHAMVSFSGDLSGNIDLDLARIGRRDHDILGVVVAEQTHAGGGVRDGNAVVTVLVAGGGAFFRQHADYLEWHVFNQDVLADRVDLALEQLLAHAMTDHRHCGGGTLIGGREVITLDHRPIKNLREVGVIAPHVGHVVDVAEAHPDFAAVDRHDALDLG